MAMTAEAVEILDPVEARNEILVQYLPLVQRLAYRVAAAFGLPVGVEPSDLVSYGIIGLVEAYERFEPGRGVKFETFAVPRVRGAIVDAIRKIDWVPRKVRARARKLNEATSTLTAELGRAPTDVELKGRMGDPTGRRPGRMPATLLALDDLLARGDDDGFRVAEVLADATTDAPGAALEDSEMRAELVDALGDLRERDRLILTLYYFENMPLSEIASVFGVTESRVSQLHTRALNALRQRLAG